MRIRLAVPDAAVHPDVLDSALEAVTRTNEHLLAAGTVPMADAAIAAGIKWRPEPPGDEHFDHAATVMQRGHGDCDDLAPWKAASLRASGEDPDATAIVRRSGPKTWHAVVQRSDGTIDDPSADAGMYEYRSPVQPRMVGPTQRPQIATKAVGSVWCARCDVPWRGSNAALSSHGIRTSQRAAISDAIHGAVLVGESAGVVEPEILTRLAGVESLIHGVHPEEVREAMVYQGMSPRAVGAFLQDMKRKPVLPAPATHHTVPGSRADMLRRLVDIMRKAGIPADVARVHADKALAKSLAKHGVSAKHVVGSLFGSILKGAVSMLPIPGAGLVANLMPDIDPTGGGGGGGAPSPGKPGKGRAAPAAGAKGEATSKWGPGGASGQITVRF